MSFITQIRAIDSRKKVVTIDYSYSFPLYNSELRRFRLVDNSDVEDKIFDQIRTILLSRVRSRIMYLLTDSDKSVNSIRIKMLRAHYPEDVVDSVINELLELGYLDDGRYAYNYANSMREYKHKSKRCIANELYAKGVSRQIIEETLAQFKDDDYELIAGAVKKKGYNSVAGIDMASRNKLYRYLLCKGFSYESINSFFNC